MRLATMKKITIAVATLLFFTTVTSLAYFFSHQEIENKFETTEGKVYINEKFLPLDGWVPGEEKQKEVRLGNDGDFETVCRIKFVPELELKDGTELNEESVLKDFVFNYTNEFNRDWEEGDDGWYYYKKVLSPGQMTPVTLKSVTMSKNVGNSELGNHKDFQKSMFTITVNSEMLQVATANKAAEYYKWAYYPQISGKEVSWFKLVSSKK